jgi:light-regulated signal transduction histidine kinase (bacteriophytochrome)
MGCGARVIFPSVRFASSVGIAIRVTCQRKDDFWKFSATNSGIGIEPSFVRKVFEIFTRLHSREKYPGTGIGLASCKRIVERHGGEIGVEPAPGGGSIFFFTLPA